MQILYSQKGQSSMMIIGIAVVVIILGGAAFFLTQNKSNTPQTSSTEESTESMQEQSAENETPATQMPAEEHMNMESEASPAAESTGKKVKVEVSGSSFKFSPSSITVNQGDTVEVTFKNTGGFHDFVIDEFNAKTKQIAAGVTDTISFVASKKGTFEYYCSVGNHRQQGMVGTLTVK